MVNWLYCNKLYSSPELEQACINFVDEKAFITSVPLTNSVALH